MFKNIKFFFKYFKKKFHKISKKKYFIKASLKILHNNKLFEWQKVNFSGLLGKYGI